MYTLKMECKQAAHVSPSLLGAYAQQEVAVIIHVYNQMILCCITQHITLPGGFKRTSK